MRMGFVVPGAKALLFFHALRGAGGRSSTGGQADGVVTRWLLVDAGSRFLTGFAGSE